MVFGRPALCFLMSLAAVSEPAHPVLNVHLAEPEGPSISRQLSSAARGVGRLLLATEEKAQRNEGQLAQAMSITSAQMSELADVAEALMQARSGRA